MLIYILFRILSPVAINAALASKALAYILVIFGILLPLARNVLGIHQGRAACCDARPSQVIATLVSFDAATGAWVASAALFYSRCERCRSCTSALSLGALPQFL